MDDPARVDRLEPFQDLVGDHRPELLRDGSELFHQVGQRLPLDQLHHDVLDRLAGDLLPPDVERPDDARVPDPLPDLGFAPEALEGALVVN